MDSLTDRDVLIQWIIEMGDRPGEHKDVDKINTLRHKGLAEWVHPNDMQNFEIIYTDKAREILINGT
jgi:hypothetical protein